MLQAVSRNVERFRQSMILSVIKYHGEWNRFFIVIIIIIQTEEI